MLLSWSCARKYEPDWVVARPVEPGYIYGVGRCGKTERPSRARELAIMRAMSEVFYQVKGECVYRFEVEEVDALDRVTLHALIDRQIIHTITNVQIVDEAFYAAAKDGYTQHTTYVLIRVPEANLPW
jgi:hypothetical protein